jgi:hypothetical protein
MGFLKQQEERLAIRFLIWQYQKLGKPTPPADELRRQASTIVDQAHRIARERGQNVIIIMKALIRDLRK